MLVFDESLLGRLRGSETGYAFPLAAKDDVLAWGQNNKEQPETRSCKLTHRYPHNFAILEE